MSTAPEILHIQVGDLGSEAFCGQRVPVGEPLICLESAEARTGYTVQPPCPACLARAREARFAEWIHMRRTLRAIAEMPPGSKGAYVKFVRCQERALDALGLLRT